MGVVTGAGRFLPGAYTPATLLRSGHPRSAATGRLPVIPSRHGACIPWAASQPVPAVPAADGGWVKDPPSRPARDAIVRAPRGRCDRAVTKVRQNFKANLFIARLDTRVYERHRFFLHVTTT
eukprot:1951429-Pleurochrysis_carterae.AAC.2